MITHTEFVQARERLLERAVSFFTAHPDAIGIFLAGSLPAGSADAYSDIDLRIIATPEAAARISPALASAFERSSVGVSAPDIDDAVVAVSHALAQQIPELHRKFELKRPQTTDLFAVDLVTKRQVA